MKIFRLVIFLILVYLLQVIVISRFAVLGVAANLPLIVTALFAVTFGAEKGFIVGLICGLIQDILGGGFYINTISFGLLGFLIGTFKESVLGTEEAVSLAAVIAATVTAFVFELLLLFFFFGKPLGSPISILITLAISCLYNSVITPVLYPAIKLSSRYLIEAE